MIKKIVPTKKVKRLILIIVLLFILIAAASYTVFIKPNLNTEQWVYKESEVTLGDLTVGVTESGTLEYGITNQLYELSLETSTSSDSDEDSEDSDEEDTTEEYLKIEDVYVVVGQRIAEGDALLKFTEDSIEDVRQLLESAKIEAEIAYAEAKSEYDLEALTAKETYQSSIISDTYSSEIYNATIEALEASISTKNLEIETLYTEITDLQDSIEDAQENVEDAKEAYDDAVTTLASMDESNTLTYIPYKTKYENYKSQYESAQSKLDQIYSDIETKEENIATLQEEITVATQKLDLEKLTAKQTYETAQVSGETAESIYNTNIASLAETLESAETDVTDATELLEAFEEFVGDGTIYAEGSGMVTEVAYEAGDSLIDQGTMVAFAKSDEMTISVDVSQEDIISLAVGDSVNIEFTAYPDEIYEGTIASITTTATSTSSATVSYPVSITVLGDTTSLYGGMTADITFVTDYKEQILYVSKNVIVEENGKTYVYMKDENGDIVLSEVTTGLSNGISVEITDGLTQDDIVYIATMVTESATDTEADAETEDTSETDSETETTTDTTSDTTTQNGTGMPGGAMPSGEMPSGMPNSGTETMP